MLHPQKKAVLCACVRLISVLVGKKNCACVRLILVLVWGTYYAPDTYVPHFMIPGTYQVRMMYQIRMYHTCGCSINSTAVSLFVYSSEVSFQLLHARKKKLTVCVSVCPDVRLILVLVWKNCLGFSVGYQRAPGWC